MRHIGGEAFDRVDAVIKPGRSWISGCRPDRRSRRSRSGKLGMSPRPPMPERTRSAAAASLHPARRWCRPDRATRTASPGTRRRKTWIRVARSGAQDIVDVAAFGGPEQHAIDGGEGPLDRDAPRTGPAGCGSSTRSAVPVSPRQGGAALPGRRVPSWPRFVIGAGRLAKGRTPITPSYSRLSHSLSPRAAVERAAVPRLHHIARQEGAASIAAAVRSGRYTRPRRRGGRDQTGPAAARLHRPCSVRCVRIGGIFGRWCPPRYSACSWMELRRSSTSPRPVACTRTTPPVSTSSASALKPRMRQVRAEKRGKSGPLILDSGSRRRTASRWRRNRRPRP